MAGCDEVVACLRRHPFSPVATEDALQREIAAAFDEAGIGYEREVRLNDKDRIDFVCSSNVGVEVKIKGGVNPLTRQVFRYLSSAQVEAVVIVTTRALHRRISREMQGKTVEVVYLSPLV